MIDVISVGELDGGDDAVCYFAKGHVDKNEFATAVLQQMDIGVDVKKVEHTYFRCVPLGDGGCYYDLATRGRGAFPVTLIDLI